MASLVYVFSVPDALEAEEFRERLEAAGFEADYVRRSGGLIQFALLEPGLTQQQIDAIAAEIQSYPWKPQRELIKSRLLEARAAVAALPSGAAKDALVAVLRLARIALRSA